MALDKATKQQIQEMASASISPKEIASSLGVPPSTVYRIIGKKPKKAESKNEKNENSPSKSEIPARARAPIKEKNEKMRKQNENSHFSHFDEDTVLEIDRDKLGQESIENLREVLVACGNGMKRAKGEDKPDKRAWQEVQYLKLMKDVAVIFGKWGGLDETHSNTSETSPIDEFVEGLKAVMEAPE